MQAGSFSYQKPPIIRKNEICGSDQIRGWNFLNSFTESDSMNASHQVLS